MTFFDFLYVVVVVIVVDVILFKSIIDNFYSYYCAFYSISKCLHIITNKHSILFGVFGTSRDWQY